MNLNSSNKNQSRACKLGFGLLLSGLMALPLALQAQSLSGDTNVVLAPVRVQDFNGGLGTAPDQTVSLANQSAVITSISNGTVTADLNPNFGSLNLVFVREILNAWEANFTSGCPTDVDIQVTFQNGEMVSTLNPSDTSSVIVESFAVDKKFKGNGCLNKASGSLRLYIDISDAVASGTYSGNMTIEVNPVF
jgi:hypothetical protein